MKIKIEYDEKGNQIVIDVETGKIISTISSINIKEGITQKVSK